MPGADQLRSLLQRIDGRGYKAYRDLRGDFDLGDLSLHVDHVQGDPFAAPSKLRVRIAMEEAGLPAAWFENRVRRIACEDLLARRVRDQIAAAPDSRRGSGKSGLIRVDAGGQEVLARTAIQVCDDWVEVRLEVGLPAAGRRVLGRQAETLLCTDVPAIARRALRALEISEAEAVFFIRCVENQENVRSQLNALGLVAVIGDGAVLPRESGASDRPMRSGALPFNAPDALRVSIPLLHPVVGDDGNLRTELHGL